MTPASLNEKPLPRAIQERMKRINDSIEAKKAAANGAPPPPDGEAPKPPADTENDPPAGAPTPPPATDPRENDPAYWRQRFNVTQGMLRTLQEQVREGATDKEREVTELREKVRALEAKGHGNDETEPDLALFFTPEQIERFGEDQCRAMTGAAIKAARQQAQTLLDTQVKPLQEAAARRTQSAESAQEATFWEKLTEAVPDWEIINAGDDWKVWLAESDAGTGLIRQDILDAHRGARRAMQVAALFQSFKKSKDRGAPPVAPPRNAGGGGQDTNPKNTPTEGYPTRDEIRDHYRKAKLNKVSEKERLAFEARLRSKPSA